MATVAARAGTLDITIEQFTKLVFTAAITDENSNAIDLTGYTFAMDVIRSQFDRTILASPTVAISGDPTAGVVSVTFTEAQIGAIAGDAIHDCRALNASAEPERLWQGDIIWKVGVTDG